MQKLEIAHQVLVKDEKMSDVAKEFRTSARVVSRVVKKAKNSLVDITDAIDDKHRLQGKLEEVAAMVVELKDSGATLSTMEDVKNAYEEKHASTVTLRQVQFVMKSILNMGYTKIIRQNIHANTERCIYSRQ